MNYKNIIMVLCGLALAACSPFSAANKTPKWQPPADVPRYGDWVVEPTTCTLHAAGADVRVETDGHLEGSLIALKLTFIPQLVRPPLVTLSGLPVPMPLDGRKQEFRTYLDYSPASVAHMAEPGTFIIISYQPLNSGYVQDVHMDTRGLMHGLAHIGKICRN